MGSLVSIQRRELSGGVSNLRMTVRKQRDGKAGFEIPFKPVEVEIGVDDDGDPMTACALDWGEARTAQRRPPLNDNDLLFMRALGAALKDHGIPAIDDQGEMAEACHEEELREAFYAIFPTKDGTPEQERTRRATTFDRVVKRAVTAGRVVVRVQDVHTTFLRGV